MDRKRHLHQAQGVYVGFCFSADLRQMLYRYSVSNLFDICGLYFFRRSYTDIPFTFRLNSDDKESMYLSLRPFLNDCLFLFIALWLMQNPGRVMVRQAENIWACSRSFRRLQYQWIVRDICIKRKGVDFGFCFSADLRQMLYRYSVSNLFDICGLYFSTELRQIFRLHSE